MKVFTRSNRGRTYWIIESTEIEGRPELPLWKDRWGYFGGWDFYWQGTQTETHRFPSTYRSASPPSSAMFNTHTHMQGTDITGSDPFQKRLFKRNIVFPSLRWSFHSESIFTALYFNYVSKCLMDDLVLKKIYIYIFFMSLLITFIQKYEFCSQK